MADESERKSLPASRKKLRDARSKGRTPHSRDLVSGFTLTCVFLYLMFAGPAVVDRLVALVNILSQLAVRPFADVVDQSVSVAHQVLLLTTLPLIVVVVSAALVSGMISTLGPVFSFELVKPEVDHINPAKGLERIFSVRNVVEFVKSSLKVAILATTFFVIVRGAIAPLFETHICGEPCLVAAAVETVKPLVASTIIAFLTIGVLDVLVQLRLFLHDMRMTRTEFKREAKDIQGDPLIRGERRRLRLQAAAGGKVHVGMQHAVIAITHGDRVVGLRFRPPETPVPLVVCKGDGESGVSMLADARQRGIPVIDNREFVTKLSEGHRVGEYIAPELFVMAAQAMVAGSVSTSR